MCEANETLNRALYALELMDGTRVYDIGKLRQILSKQCSHHEHGETK